MLVFGGVTYIAPETLELEDEAFLLGWKELLPGAIWVFGNAFFTTSRVSSAPDSLDPSSKLSICKLCVSESNDSIPHISIRNLDRFQETYHFGSSKIIWNHLSKQHVCSSSRFIVEVYIDHCYVKCFFRGKTLSYPIHPSGYPRSRQRSVRRWTSLSPEMLPSESRSRRAKRGPFSFPTKTWENSSRNQHTMCWVKKEMCFSENGWWIYHIPPQIRKYISILIYMRISDHIILSNPLSSFVNSVS